MTGEPLRIPDEFLLDDRAWYLLRHHRHRFTPQELAAERWLLLASKEWGSIHRERNTTTLYERAFAEIRIADPELAGAIERRGARAILLEAVERVVKDHGAEIRWNLCPRCAGLCRAPAARQCFRCGHDWHNLPANDPT